MSNPDTNPPSLYAAREPIFPRRVYGFFRNLKWALMIVLLGIYYITPWIRWDRPGALPDQAVLGGPLHDGVLVHRDEGRAEVAAVAVHQDLADVGADRLEVALEGLGRDVLAARGLDEVLLAVGDFDAAFLINLANIAGVEPAIFNVFSSGSRIFPVTKHNIFPPAYDLSPFPDGKFPALIVTNLNFKVADDGA